MKVDMKTLSTLTALLFFLLLAASAGLSRAGETSRYMRSMVESADIPKDSPLFYTPPGFNAPQQVHITQGDYEGTAVMVSWVTPVAPAPSVVYYGKEKGMYTEMAVGKMSTYTFYNYSSGFIHHATIKGLQYDTTYYYQLGQGDVARDFFFKTAPNDPNGAYTFGLIGDLGQTFDSLATLQHYENSTGASVLNVGDLSYADRYPYYDNQRWDTFGRLVESSAAYQAWSFTVGNHDIEYLPSAGEFDVFKAYNHRYPTPYKFSNSSSPLWYSFKRGPATIIVLSSYSGFVKYTPQWLWLTDVGFPAVDRAVTPWLIVLFHIPWYNSNTRHYMEGEPMRAQYESDFVNNKVDVVFSGHVHSYERMYPVKNVEYNISNGMCTPEVNDTAPTYVVIGDGGNSEGVAVPFSEPQPSYSAYREASFGHGLLEIANQTHAFFTWHRNQDGEKVVSDSTTILNKFYMKSDLAAVK